MKRSESIKNLAKALCTFQSEVKPIMKDSENPAFKKDGKANKYASLTAIVETIAPILTKCGLSFSQFPEGEDKIALTSILMHADSGEWMESTFVLNAESNLPQKIGSAITYGRRYALSSILGIVVDEDDDGNTASGTNVNQQQAAKNKADKQVEARHAIDLAPWDAELAKCKTEEDLGVLYKQNKDTVDKVPEIMALFSKRRKEVKPAA